MKIYSFVIRLNPFKKKGGNKKPKDKTNFSFDFGKTIPKNEMEFKF
jgi:hypothetical protein